jgi:hypothetical protein
MVEKTFCAQNRVVGYRIEPDLGGHRHMDNVLPFLYVFGLCCIGPVLIFSIGVYIGRHGMPIRIQVTKTAKRYATEE